jgi:hypothetical protein
MMHGPIKVKSPNTINKWQMGFNSEFKGLKIKKAVHEVGVLQYKRRNKIVKEFTEDQE